MNGKYLLLTGYMLVIFNTCLFSQDNWTLKLNKEGIKVYTKNLENSPYKAIKTICTINASVKKVTAVLLDVNTGADWIYATKKCTLLKQVSPLELFYYSEIAIPWPVSNRDFIVHLKVWQDKKTGIVTVEGDNKPTYLPEYKNIVRIQQSYSKWLVIPLPNGQVQIEHLLQVDPGGAVPAWLINMFATKGPYESFKNLRLQVKKQLYAQVNLPFIKD